MVIVYILDLSCILRHHVFMNTNLNLTSGTKYCKHCGTLMSFAPTSIFDEDTGKKIFSFQCLNRNCTSFCMKGKHVFKDSGFFSKTCVNCGMKDAFWIAVDD